MRLMIAVAVLVASLTAMGQDKPVEEKKPDFDPDAYKLAQERLAAKGANGATTQPMDIEQLRIENAALRQRIATLENMLGISAKPAVGVVGAGKTYQTYQELLGTIKYPADQLKPWTDLQMEKARRDISAAIVGAKFQTTMKLDGASARNGVIACRFTRTLADKQKESLTATFEPRFTDLVTSWKTGQGVTFVGTIDHASISHNERDGVTLSITLVKCVPQK